MGGKRWTRVQQGRLCRSRQRGFFFKLLGKERMRHEEGIQECKGIREGLCTSRRLKWRREKRERGKEGRRRHVRCSMIYRLHCHHGDFCQPSLRSKVVVQTATLGGWWWGEGVTEGGERGWRKVEGVLTKIPSCACAVSAPWGGFQLM